MKVAIPTLSSLIAPCFEAATTFFIATVSDQTIQDARTLTCEGSNGFRRVRLMRLHDVDTLVCNGIKNHYRDMLTASGLCVICRISVTVDQAIRDLIDGRLAESRNAVDQSEVACAMPHCQLLEWAKELFIQNGYSVSSGPGEDAFPVDIVAETICPECHRPVRVAICCGAHAYRSITEITEFHHATRSDYHARVYISPANPTIESYCRDYGIELVDPGRTEISDRQTGGKRLPILKGAIHDHERLSPP